MNTSNIQKISETRFKKYDQNVVVQLPILLASYAKNNVLAQLVNKIVDDIDVNILSEYYSKKGCPAYHPKMMIKLWVYGFCNKVYTSRHLAKQIRENLIFMWFSGGAQPCFKTLSNFRGNRMSGIVDHVLEQVLVYLVTEGYIDLNDLYTDGSKWEACANRHKVIWGKNTKRYKAQVQSRISKLLEESQSAEEAENARYGKGDLPEHQPTETVNNELNSEELQAEITHLNELLEEATKEKRRDLKKKCSALNQEQDKLLKYERQESVLNGRNSYSKTDPDATAMKMKDERTRPGYNVQITTSNQFIVGCSLHQNPSDSVCLNSHISGLQQRMSRINLGEWAPDITLDAGYGSEENYALLEDKGLTAYMKFPSWYREQHEPEVKRRFRRESWSYNAEADYYTCPQGKQLHFIGEEERITANGYCRTLRVYESEGCKDCPLFLACRGEDADLESNRTVRYSEQLEVYKQQARELLETEEGQKKRSQRSVDVETPFGNIKHNMKHRRFILRGKEKVHIEFSLLAIAHNLIKVFCQKTGIWQEQYVQRAGKRKKNRSKGA